MRLDRYRRSTNERNALDYVGVERALGEKFRASSFPGFLFENVDEELADGLALLLGILDAGERLEERFGRIHVHKRNVVTVKKKGHDLLRLSETHQAMVNKDAGQLFADRLMDQHGCHCGIDAARQAANHAPLADLLADLFNRLLLKGAHGPVTFKASDLTHKVAKDRRSVRRVHHLKMELRGVEFALVVAD